MQQMTSESITTLRSMPKDTVVLIMVEDELLDLQSPYWELACEAPDHHVYEFKHARWVFDYKLAQWTLHDLAQWLGGFHLEDDECWAYAMASNGEEGYPLVGFTVSDETDPPQVIFYVE